MKIVVLAGGLSPERNVSLSTGTMVTEALRALGHRAGLIDLYFGLETGGADEAFFDAPVSEAYKKISREAPDLSLIHISSSAKPVRSTSSRASIPAAFMAIATNSPRVTAVSGWKK